MTANIRDQIALQMIGVAHLGVASAVHRGCFAESWGERAIAELLAMPGSFGLLATIDGQPAGLAMAYSVEAEGEILTLCVLPAHRQRGIAAGLLMAVLDKLVRQGCRRVLLEVAADNMPAHALYGKAAFKEVGRRVGYYRRSASLNIDAVVLAATIGVGMVSAPVVARS